MKTKVLLSTILFFGALAIQAQEVPVEETNKALITPAMEITNKSDLKEFNRKQAEIKAQQKSELKHQKEIEKTQKKLAKITNRLNRTKNTYQKRSEKLSNQLIKGKIAPVKELKEKQRLHKMQTKISNLEFQLTTTQAKHDALTK